MVPEVVRNWGSGASHTRRNNNKKREKESMTELLTQMLLEAEGL